jgi:hypothetical protein
MTFIEHNIEKSKKWLVCESGFQGTVIGILHSVV